MDKAANDAGARGGLERTSPPVAVCGLTAFAVIVLAELAINPGLDPARHEISEYVHAQLGPLMTAGFVCWAISLGATSVAVSTKTGSRLISVLLAVACIGMAVAAAFATQTSAGQLPRGETLTTAGRLHDVGSGASTIALFVAAVLSLFHLGDDRFRRAVAALLIVLVTADIALLAAGAGVAGVRQRLLIAGACVWQLLLLRTLPTSAHKRSKR